MTEQNANDAHVARTEPPPRRFGVNILQRYVLIELIGAFAGCVLILSLTLFAITSVRLMHKGLNIIQLHRTGVALFMSFLPFMLPFAYLAATVMALGRLSSDNEINTVRASGIHPGRVVLPVLLVGLALSGLAFLLNSSLVPRFQAKLISVDVEIFRGFLGRLESLPSNVISLPAYDMLVGDVEGTTCRDVVVFHARGNTVQRIIRAEEMVMHFEPGQRAVQLLLHNGSIAEVPRYPLMHMRVGYFQTLRADVDMGFKTPKWNFTPSALELKDLFPKSDEVSAGVAAYAGRLDDPKKARRRARKESDRLLIELQAARSNLEHAEEALEAATLRLVRQRHKCEFLRKQAKEEPSGDWSKRLEKEEAGLRRIEAVHRARQADLEKSRAEMLRLQRSLFMSEAKAKRADLECMDNEIKMEIQQRFSLSFAPLVLGLIGAPLGVRVTRKGFLPALAVSFAVALLVYYPLFVLSSMLASGAARGVPVFAWLPNVLVAALGLVMSWFVLRK